VFRAAEYCQKKRALPSLTHSVCVVWVGIGIARAEMSAEIRHHMAIFFRERALESTERLLQILPTRVYDCARTRRNLVRLMNRNHKEINSHSSTCATHNDEWLFRQLFQSLFRVSLERAMIITEEQFQIHQNREYRCWKRRIWKTQNSAKRMTTF
jgi:hypothetical protein